MTKTYRGKTRTAIYKNKLWYLPLEQLPSLSLKMNNPYSKYRGPFYMMDRLRTLRSYNSDSLAAKWAEYDKKYMEFFDCYLTLRNIATEEEVSSPAVSLS